ncbi:MAG: hypothetical protein JAY95_10345 [Candidatus Thiodiazotropha taylori]|nr:hypothetical protein [Candidatus Thiodiazotropha taylori]
MNSMTHSNLSGALFYSIKQIDFWDVISDAKHLLSPIKKQIPGWYHFVASPEEHWLEDDYSEQIRPSYDFWIREGRLGRFLLVSTKKQLVEILFSNLGLDKWINNTPYIDAPGLVSDLMKTPRTTPYSLGVIWARVEGQGQSLRTIALYGNDLGSSNLFRDELEPMISPYRLTLRKHQITEIITIGSRGEISFPFQSIETFIDIDDALRVISHDLRRLDWTLEE